MWHCGGGAEWLYVGCITIHGYFCEHTGTVLVLCGSVIGVIFRAKLEKWSCAKVTRARAAVPWVARGRRETRHEYNKEHSCFGLGSVGRGRSQLQSKVLVLANCTHISHTFDIVGQEVLNHEAHCHGA